MGDGDQAVSGVAQDGWGGFIARAGETYFVRVIGEAFTTGEYQLRINTSTIDFPILSMLIVVPALAYAAWHNSERRTRSFCMTAFAVPLLLMRKTQEAYLSHTRRSAQKLRQAA